MMKNTIFLVIISLLTFSVQTPAADLKNYRELTVLIQNIGKGEGTGVLIDNTHVLTCLHISKTGKDDFLVYTYPLGRVVEAKIEFLDPSNDLLILVLKEPVKIAFTPVFEHHVEIGEPITIVGNVLGTMTWFVSKGIISAIRNQFFLTDTLVNPGNSGGPWFNESGDIVAITDWRTGPSETDHYPGFAAGIPGGVVDAFLDTWGRIRDSEAMRSAVEGKK